MNETPKLTPGVGFHLEGDGQWDVQEIPQHVLDNAEYIGDLTIKGYDSAIFETPEGDQWAQKSSGIPAPKGDEATQDVLATALGRMASRIADRPLRRQ